MKKFLIPLVAIALSISIQPAEADGPPAADVSCSLSDTGIRYGVSMVFTGTGVSFNSLRYEWDVLVAEGGKNPTLISSYGPRTFHTLTSANALELTYETLLGIAKNDSNASVLFYANSVFSDGISTLTNKTGKGCYVVLADVLKNKNERALALQKAAAEKAAADKAAAEKATTDKVAIDAILQNLQAKNQSIDDLIAKNLLLYPSLKGNLVKYGSARPLIPSPLSQEFTLTNAQDLEKRFDDFVLNLNSMIKQWSKSVTSTITCTKGKIVKKVTGRPAKCPAGYIQK
jgi:hypothetical protein